MTYCVKCGAQVDDHVNFCPHCGAAIPNSYGDDPYGGYSYDQNNSYDQSYTYNQNNSYDQSYTYDQNNAYNQDYGYGQNNSYGQDAGWFSQADVQDNKVMGVVSYLGILVLIPLLAFLAGDESSPYLKHHINQGLSLFIINAALEFVERVVDNVIPIGWVLSWPVGIVEFALFIILIMGIVSACKGTRKPLPIVGSIHILK